MVYYVLSSFLSVFIEQKREVNYLYANQWYAMAVSHCFASTIYRYRSFSSFSLCVCEILPH